jgi:hypothetical protein
VREDVPPGRAQRILAAVVVAAVAAGYWFYAAWANPGGASDFDQLWAGARALTAGENPYDVVRVGAPGPVAPFKFDLYYPLPTLLAVMPFAWLPIVEARAAFCALSFGMLSFLMTRRAWYPLVGLASGAGFMTLSLAQWSGLTAAAVLAPALGLVAAAKPNTHLAVVASYRTVRDVALGLGSGLVLFLVSFAVQPGWVADWREALRNAPTLRPLAFELWGWLLLIALIKWKRPAARWLLATFFLPGTPIVYAALPLFAFRWSFRTTLVLALLSHVAMWPALLAPSAGSDFVSYVAVSGPALVLLVYVPAAIFLVREPNEESESAIHEPAPVAAPLVREAE